jgi:hypothetical protein
MPAFVPSPSWPSADLLRPSAGATVIPWCQTSMADGSGNLVGGGAANSGPIASPPMPFRSEVWLTARCQLWRATATGGDLVPSAPTVPTYVTLSLSPDGVTFVDVATRMLSQFHDDSCEFDLQEFRSILLGYPVVPGPPGYPAAPGSPGVPGYPGPTVPPMVYRVRFDPPVGEPATLVECVESP